MKKNILGLFVLVFFLPCVVIADTTENNFDPLEFCPQLYIASYSSAYKGTPETCKKVWDYYLKTNNYCGLALMSFNGQGEQPVSSQKALIYAQKLPEDDDYSRDDYDMGGCTRDNVLSLLKSSTADDRPLTYTDVAEHDRVFDESQYAALSFQSYVYKAKHGIFPLTKKINPQQMSAFEILWKNYLSLLDQIDQAYPDYDIPGKMNWEDIVTYKEGWLQDFQDDITKLLVTSPPLAPTTQATVDSLDKQLNITYKKVYKLYATSAAGTSGNEQDLINFERAWLKYRDAYIQFVEQYYNGRYKPDDVRLAYLAILTKDQIDTLNEWIGDIKDMQDEQSDTKQ